MNKQLMERFLRYVKVYTTSDPTSDTYPSTKRQFDLLNMLADELRDMGLEVEQSEYGYVYGTLKSNIDYKVPTVGFVAHVDTAPDITGENVKPQIIEDYQGDVIKLGESGYELNPEDFPELLKYKGQTIITTDGTTLLGADDKAGVTEIMEAVKYLTEHPEIKHGDIKVGFTPDEEIGKGVIHFDVKEFGADFAYTMDGGEIGEVQYENFNASSAVINIEGRNVHPGTAKGQMINAQSIGFEIDSLLPQEQRPQFTEGYEGFFHLIESKGDVTDYQMTYIIRDHDMDKFKEKQALLDKVVKEMQTKYPKAKIELTQDDTYYNMKEPVEKMPEIMEYAVKALEEADIKPLVQPIRGGTDGANLSFMGLPCPNIFAGGHNFHGRFEYVPVESMEKATEVIVNICSIIAEDNK